MNALESYMLQKGAEYVKFDPNRIKRIYGDLESYLPRPPKIIQIIGTNGKGTSGRFLALALIQNGAKVLHFTSPHIFHFSERFYKNGAVVSDSELLEAHNYLQSLESAREASYFEYVTLLALQLAHNVDFLILEAGVGGEFDSTSAVPRDLVLFSAIDFDHKELLGDTIEAIATTKLKAMVNPSIVGIQRHNEVQEIARNLATQKRATLHFVESVSDEIMRYLAKYNLAEFLGENLALSLKALEILGLQCDLDMLPRLDLAGRFQQISKNIIIDVGHNELGAHALKSNLKDKKVILVYNSYFQKNIEAILRILKDNIIRLEIISVSGNPRIIEREKLVEIVEKLGIKYGEFSGITESATYLVCGSFAVVERFMQMQYNIHNLAQFSESFGDIAR